MIFSEETIKTINKIKSTILDDVDDHVDHDDDYNKSKLELNLDEKHSSSKIIYSPIKQTSTEYQKVLEFEESLIQSVKANSINLLDDQEIELIKMQQQQKIDELVIEQTLEEVTDSLDAVHEELIEVVKDGKLIKQSPSEFEFKISSFKTAKDPVLEPYQEEIKEDISQISSNDESLIIRRNQAATTTASKKPPTNRWSINDPENQSSSGDSHYQSFDSRPVSSDIDNIMTSEYQTAHSQSTTIPGSTEFHTALSSQSATISSRDSMKSLNSESSGNFGSIEISEASETLVASLDDDLNDEKVEQMKFGSLDDYSSNILMEKDDADDDLLSSSMKRSQEMIFEILEKKEDEFKYGTSIDESKFGSLEDGSILSVSMSSQSCIETVMEMLPSVDEILTTKDDSTITTSTEPFGKFESLIMTSSYVQEDDKHNVNTQITTSVESSSGSSKIFDEIIDDLLIKSTDSSKIIDETAKRSRGHKRSDSTVVVFKTSQISQLSTDDSLEDIPPTIPQEIATTTTTTTTTTDCEKSGSDSDYDRFETEYSRAFKIPTNQPRKKSGDYSENEAIIETEPRKSFSPSHSIIEPIIEDIHEETILSKELEDEAKRKASQNMQMYSNIPDITITVDLTKYVSDSDEEEEAAAVAAAPPIKYAQEVEYSINEEKYEELFSKDDLEEIEKPESPGSDSFEMLEQPDISDEFVIIEEVAKEADEFDTEGKSVSIVQTKYIKKHDDEVEKYIVKSAPAATNEGSMLYSGVREDMNFEFEDSPPNLSSEQDPETYEQNKKWVEMQMRYPYDMERGPLEDIKEEDTDMEVGSSRISSFKDSFSSTPEYDVLAGRRYFTKEHDEVSISSLQEFESLEQAISLENRKFHSGSHDSSSNGSFTKRYIAKSHQGDDVSLSSLKDFEGLENACIEAHLIEIKAKEEAALLLSRSDESNKSDEAKKSSPKNQSTVTTIVTTTKIIQSGSSVPFPQHIRSKFDLMEDEISNTMETSTDSLDAAKMSKNSHFGSSDSLDNIQKDPMTCSIDSIEVFKSKLQSSKYDADSIQFEGTNRSDSLDSIELQSGCGMSIAYKKDFHSGFENISNFSILDDKNVTTTVTTSTVPTTTNLTNIPEIQKDISNDSLNSGSNLQDSLLTSCDSLSRSTSTNATYQHPNEYDSQMSGSMTSCDSNTMIDTLDSDFILHQPAMEHNLATSSSSTSTSTGKTAYEIQNNADNLDYFEFYKSGGQAHGHSGSLFFLFDFFPIYHIILLEFTISFRLETTGKFCYYFVVAFIDICINTAFFLNHRYRRAQNFNLIFITLC